MGWIALAALACGEPHPVPAPAARSGATELPDDVAGCYALFGRHGGPASDSLYFAPERVRLDTVPFGYRADSTWTAIKLDPGGRRIGDARVQHGSRYRYSDQSRDTISLLFHTGRSGSELFLSITDGRDTLRGRAVEHWDLGPSTTDAGPVTVIRIPCRTEQG